MPEQSLLFTPVQIGNLELKNRLVRSATAELLATEPVGRATPALAQLYRQLARGGIGLIITGHAYIAPRGKAHPEMLGVHCDQMLTGLRSLTEAVHAEGGRIAMQINHGGRQCDPACTPETLAPSAVALPDREPPHEMTHDHILATVTAYGSAARRAQDAGFDAVQIHAAHGYLISQFLSPHTNQRTDAWGGDFERRLRFLAAICEEVRGQVGPDYPVCIKMGMMDNLEQVPDGLTPEEGALIVDQLSGFGVNGVEISGGYGGGSDFNTRTAVGSKEVEGYFRPLARRAKAATKLPVFLVGGLRSRSVMEDVLESGDADLVSMCRPLIREPDLPHRLQTGETLASACISGSRCWPKQLGQGIQCKCES
jgi:2,4-dienoyl-CoA reductase-like NADH-dependent reductase (Old Yellow Enzyme family)